ncbi:YbaB/EbfC family nucleoid-associated protein [Amorphus orientalis]|uniref:Nucleoid-associated protein J2S73_001669 n=1 Tax=Amorphus orientalis TaxID=649198 RepID=A0AAE3VNB6_9HYPH|nr:YbaB/EbfC family nucleoid-associated protein [Amorphus orientalis]MDQ0315212.1 DNA-binding YbaB/EbfC family protein [Amorphus orientalis]
MDFMKMMKQAKELQSKMGDLQEQMGAVEAEGTSGGGLVKVRVNGKQELLGVTIDPTLMKPEEAEILEDLIVAAHTDAKAKVDVAVQEKTQEIMSGMGLPPGMMPGM